MSDIRIAKIIPSVQTGSAQGNGAAPYSLDPNEVKKLIDLKLANKKYSEEQFIFYHLNRNYFNVKNEISSLKAIGDGMFLDNQGQKWREESTIKNFFHMPKTDYIKGIVGWGKLYSRKFLRDDNSILKGEFEIIIMYNGKRIDADTNKEYQETYNFARTRDFWDHKKLDVEPHEKFKDYTSFGNKGYVKIIDKKEK
jgi:hypothetical protein